MLRLYADLMEMTWTPAKLSSEICKASLRMRDFLLCFKMPDGDKVKWPGS